jgi:hypothetical protein
MYALQMALREASIPWLKIGGPICTGDIPWIWLYQDANIALQLNALGFPFIIGPNVLFGDSHRPGESPNEPALLNAEHCVMQFTESEWYAALIHRNCNLNTAPIVLWSYPIHPQPDGPLEPMFDVLIYLKDMSLGRQVIRLQEKWPRSALVVYGHYDRETMIDMARSSRCCAYLSTDDRGPLAAAEIALAGCPLIGIERGCPWTTNPDIGIKLPYLGDGMLVDACKLAMQMGREAVREAALDYFSADNAVETIREALEPLAMGD